MKRLIIIFITISCSVCAIAQSVSKEFAPQTITANTNNPPAATKILRDGHIFILVGDRTYTITGQRVE